MLRIVIFLAAALVVACQDSRGSGSDDSPWYRKAVARNLSQSAEPDSVVIVARGPRADSLRIHLSILVGDKEAFATDWTSDYELVDADSALKNSPKIDSVMRAHLDRVFSSIAEEPLDTTAMRLNGDTVLLRNLQRPYPHQFVLSYGYRSTIALIWDARERRFLKAYTCC